jgi:peptide/nickel transport system substrate-binding protein/oligopeptide transport system substrate-binding protein
MPDELHSWPMFRIFYLSFDTTKPPFDDIRVRYAINHASNREELCSTVLKDLASPEYSLLVKGFPGYDDAEEAKESSKFDPELAKKLLAEAGYPDGKGFPELELWIRAEDQLMPWQKPAAEYIQAQLKENLGINIIPRIMEVKTFTDALNQRTHNFFLLAYQFDYVDPSNFMDLYLTGGRHAWSSDEYDELVRKADSLGEWEQRVEKYREAERILAKECPAVFLFQQQYSAAWKPFLKGEGLEPNKDGLSSWGDMWARYAVTHIYISKH